MKTTTSRPSMPNGLSCTNTSKDSVRLRWAPWPYFHQGDKPNKVHFRATHWHCIDAQQPKDKPIDVEASADVKLIKMAEQFADGAQEEEDDNFTGATALLIYP
ncbi:hypothetical protein GGX14DRAFT_398942 [Mycena pura]|uniref:Uncharacterized protein n=1 Tax=Mycena pura TaxID=153505 RepID=A0AAD6YD51_9AGAR|nr:hypothetical protein GGX14DRAFT_398942 [Mycena pura]